MPVLTTIEIQEALAERYKAKQGLSDMDDQFNRQAADIMSAAQKQVEELRATYTAQRQSYVDALAFAERRLEKGM